MSPTTRACLDSAKDIPVLFSRKEATTANERTKVIRCPTMQYIVDAALTGMRSKCQDYCAFALCSSPARIPASPLEHSASSSPLVVFPSPPSCIIPCPRSVGEQRLIEKFLETTSPANDASFAVLFKMPMRRAPLRLGTLLPT